MTMELWQLCRGPGVATISLRRHTGKNEVCVSACVIYCVCTCVWVCMFARVCVKSAYTCMCACARVCVFLFVCQVHLEEYLTFLCIKVVLEQEGGGATPSIVVDNVAEGGAAVLIRLPIMV